MYFTLSETGLIPIITDLTSTTSSITVHWSHPSNHSELVNNYEVIWRTEETSTESTGLLDKSVKQFSISRYLMAGQLYIVNVIAHVDKTYVLARSAVHSMDATVRLGMIFQNSLFNWKYFKKLFGVMCALLFKIYIVTLSTVKLVFVILIYKKKATKQIYFKKIQM